MLTEWQKDAAVVVGLVLGLVQAVAGLFSLIERHDFTIEEWEERRAHNRQILRLLARLFGVCLFSEIVVVLICADYWLFGKQSGLAWLRFATTIEALFCFILFFGIYRKDNYSLRMSLLLGSFCCLVFASSLASQEGQRIQLINIVVQQVEFLKLPAVAVLIVASAINLHRTLTFFMQDVSSPPR